MTSRRPPALAPSEIAAALGALLEDPVVGLTLVYDRAGDDGPGFGMFPAGPPRQLAALLAWYAASVRRRGWGWLVDDAAAFARLLTAARHPRVPAPVRSALTAAVYWPDVLELAQWAAQMGPAIRDEGRDLLQALAAPARRPAGDRSQDAANAAATAAWLGQPEGTPHVA
jgi:hypothetical protein